MGFLKNPSRDPENPRWGISHLENRHDVIFSAEGGPIWIKFGRLVENDMSTVVICGNGNQM